MTLFVDKTMFNKEKGAYTLHLYNVRAISILFQMFTQFLHILVWPWNLFIWVDDMKKCGPAPSFHTDQCTKVRDNTIECKIYDLAQV